MAWEAKRGKTSGNLKAKFEHIEMAVKLRNNSAPGLDGIPYVAWRSAGRQALVTLYEVVAQFEDEDFDEAILPVGFNNSLLCCLPKKAVGYRPHLGRLLSSSSHSPFIPCQH